MLITAGAKMKKYKTEKVEHEVRDVFICDRCKKHIQSDDIFELQETYSIGFTGGYNSVFGDGNYVECDLCQDCLKKLIGDFCTYSDDAEE
jgi:hypothetical protein